MTPQTRFLCTLVLTLAATGTVFGDQDPTPVEADWEATISLDFTDASIHSVLEEIGSVGKFQFIFDDRFDFDAKTSVSLSDISVLDALRFVTRSNRLFYVDRGTATILIAPDTRQKRQEHRVQMLRTFQLEHADPRNVITVLRSLLQTRNLVHNERLNTLTMKDTTGQLDIAEELIRRLDRDESPDLDAPDRQPLWVGNDFNQDMCTIGDAIPQLEIDLEQAVVFDSEDATARDVYDTLARSAGIQFVFDDEVDLGQPASSVLPTMSVQEALEAVGRHFNLFSVVWGPRTVAIVPDGRARRLVHEHVAIQFFYLSHAEPREVITALRSLIQVRQIAEIPRLRAVVLKDTVTNLESAQELVEGMDRPGEEPALANR